MAVDEKMEKAEGRMSRGSPATVQILELESFGLMFRMLACREARPQAQPYRDRLFDLVARQHLKHCSNYGLPSCCSAYHCFSSSGRLTPTSAAMKSTRATRAQTSDRRGTVLLESSSVPESGVFQVDELSVRLGCDHSERLSHLFSRCDDHF